MIYANKPKKYKSIKPKDKRKISLLNADFKVLTGIEAARHNTMLDHTVSPQQFAVGKNKRIHHAISLARDIANNISLKGGGAIADLDYLAAFDLICMKWIYLVLEKKGLHPSVFDRILF